MIEGIFLFVKFMEASLAAPETSPLLAALRARGKQSEEQILSAHLAEIVPRSASRMRAVFKQAMCCTPLQYFRRRRREKARQLAETTTLPIHQILRELGVDDASHFLRNFKKQFGKTMTDCRREAQAQQADAPENITKNC